MSIRVAVDIGGTFVDCVAYDREAEHLSLEKTPTTPEDLPRGVVNGIEKIDVDADRIRTFIHGTTLGINAFLEREGAEIGLVTNDHFADILEIGRYDRPAEDMYYVPYEGWDPLVPRHRRIGVPCRMNVHGEEIEGLDEAATRERIENLVESYDVDALAVCLLHGYKNPKHERRIAEIADEIDPNISVSISSDIINEYREYERMSTTALDAYIKPIFESYVDELDNELSSLGIESTFLITRSGGGSFSAEKAKTAPVHTIMSGPAGGLIGASYLSDLLDRPDLIAVDMGGTSLDTCVIHDGTPEVTYDSSLEHIPIMIPVYDIRTIGAGGGSIAWMDENLLKVGPQSSGADPGPICYGRGGTDPTVTDAALTLGYLDPDYFLGGEMDLDVAHTEALIREKLSDPMDMDVSEVSRGIYDVTKAKTSNAIREITVEKGLDPRDFSMLTFGGAGPMFIPLIAEDTGVKEVIVPRAPSVFSAWGMLMAEVVYDFSQTTVTQLQHTTLQELEQQYEALERRTDETLADENIPSEDRILERGAAMRYYGQEHSVMVPIQEAGDLDELERAFEAQHEAQYGHTMDDPVEIVHLRVRGRGTTQPPELTQLEEKPATEPVGTQDAYCFVEEEYVPFSVYHRDELGPGAAIAGPAIIQEPTTTIVFQSDQDAEIDAYGNVVITRGGVA